MRRTALSRVRGLGSAKDGTGHWWAQRLTSLALVPLSLWFVVSVISLVGAGHAAAAAWMGANLTTLLLLLLIAVTFRHVQLGLQVIIEDYVHHERIKLASIISVNFASVALGLAAVLAVLRVWIGA